MNGNFLEPWFPSPEVDLMRLALEAADDAGRAACDAWPELRKGGVAFGDLPPFLCWRGRDGLGEHLLCLQPREAGALVPGARVGPLPPGWLETLDMDAFAAPLARHPDFPGGASVQVVGILAPGRAKVRTWGRPAPHLVAAFLARTTVVPDWGVEPV
jgi:hypothetical protein